MTKGEIIAAMRSGLAPEVLIRGANTRRAKYHDYDANRIEAAICMILAEVVHALCWCSHAERDWIGPPGKAGSDYRLRITAAGESWRLWDQSLLLRQQAV